MTSEAELCLGTHPGSCKTASGFYLPGRSWGEGVGADVDSQLSLFAKVSGRLTDDWNKPAGASVMRSRSASRGHVQDECPVCSVSGATSRILKGSVCVQVSGITFTLLFTLRYEDSSQFAL